ncbi:MAG: allantoicase [Actinobacteria bacterium]|nr:allantoicase [Actinomycetota bacterium]
MHELLIDLAGGGRVLQASDEYLNPAERLLDPADPVADPGRPGPRGGWLDGWETRRARPPGHEWAIIRLGQRGRIHHVVVDTTHVVASLPEACSLEAIDLPGDPNLVDLVRSRSLWHEIVPRHPVRGSGAHGFEVEAVAATHLRLVIYPDGGIARLRVLGDPLPPDDLASRGAVDLASSGLGGRVIDVSDAGRSAPNSMLAAGDGKDHLDGWITRRRRTPGHEWAVVRLAGRGTIERIEIDTRRFPGDSPAEVAVMGIDAPGTERPDPQKADWRPLLTQTTVEPGARSRFDHLEDDRPVTHLRLDLHPDGAVARFRAFGPAVPTGDETDGSG